MASVFFDSKLELYKWGSPFSQFVVLLSQYVLMPISAVHLIADQDPEALVPRHLVGVLPVPAEDGITHHSMIITEETIGGLIEIMQGIAGGGGTHVFLSPLSLLQELSKNLNKISCVYTTAGKYGIKGGKAIEWPRSDQ